mgnify:CR=1 FL=1
MIITKTPFRMSFLAAEQIWKFFKEYGGAVISTTFDKYCYVMCAICHAFSIIVLNLHTQNQSECQI